MLKEYKIAAIVTVQAHSYDEAVKKAEDNLSFRTNINDEGVDLVYDYESDNRGQRVVYLPGIEPDDRIVESDCPEGCDHAGSNPKCSYSCYDTNEVRPADYYNKT